MSIFDNFIKNLTRPGERSSLRLRRIRKVFMLGIVTFILVGIVGGYLFEHTPMMRVVIVLLTVMWVALTLLALSFLYSVFFGGRE
jgi:hypothetical protein